MYRLHCLKQTCNKHNKPFKKQQHKGCRGAVSRMKAKVMQDPDYVLLWQVEFEELESDEEE